MLGLASGGSRGRLLNIFRNVARGSLKLKRLGGGIYTTEIGQCSKSELSLWRRELVYQHTTTCTPHQVSFKAAWRERSSCRGFKLSPAKARGGGWLPGRAIKVQPLASGITAHVTNVI